MTPRNWSQCVAVRVDGQRFQRELACGHEQPLKPLEYLNEQARKNPEAMKGSNFPCNTCLTEAEKRYRP